jgi:hypothetical protein
MHEDPTFLLNRLRKILDELLKPETLNQLVKLKEELGDEKGMLARWEWFTNNRAEGADCHYAKLAKDLFLRNNGDNVITLICWLNDNWASKCK